jgi:hypothetical protein
LLLHLHMIFLPFGPRRPIAQTFCGQGFPGRGLRDMGHSDYETPAGLKCFRHLR